MQETTSDRRLAENEVIFRQINEQVQEGIDQINKYAAADNQPELHITQTTNDTPLSFYCECSDEKCTERIRVNHIDYNEIHNNRSRFVIKKDHQVASIEKIVKEETEYLIIEKTIAPPISAEYLNTTELDSGGNQS